MHPTKACIIIQKKSHMKECISKVFFIYSFDFYQRMFSTSGYFFTLQHRMIHPIDSHSCPQVHSAIFFLCINTLGPWLLLISVVRFSLVRKFKIIQLYLARANFHQIPSLVRSNRHEPNTK